MPFYHQLGSIPPKRHTVFEKADGSGIHYEQLFGTEGFHGMASLLYHLHRPTMIKTISEPLDARPKAALGHNLNPRMLQGFKVKPTADFLASRRTVLFNDDVALQNAAPTRGTEGYFYKNGDSDELIFVHKGSGVLTSLFGTLTFGEWDYLVIPRGTIYQITFDSPDNRLFITESRSPILTPKRYRNEFGQLLEHSPFCERDLRRPTYLAPTDALGEFTIKIKKEGLIYDVVYASHPFDVVGWVHQTFEGHNFVVCTFAPRMYDYHPKSIPAPYNHSNIDSDEVLYYVDGDFMSRNHVEQGFISLHPGGIPHGPHPGAYERSIGQKETQELAVMVDTFRPLRLTQDALDIEWPGYAQSWL
jgi:homogentisate 1,2-dioxygenase